MNAEQLAAVEKATNLYTEGVCQLAAALWAQMVAPGSVPGVVSLADAASLIRAMTGNAFRRALRQKAPDAPAFDFATDAKRDSAIVVVCALCSLLKHNPLWDDAVALSIQKQAAIEQELVSYRQQVEMAKGRREHGNATDRPE